MDLPVGRIRTYSISQDDNEQLSDEDPSMFLRGRSNSTTVKEIEDHRTREKETSKEDSLRRKGIAITDEVKKMGLTANVSHYVKDDEGFLVHKIRNLKQHIQESVQVDIIPILKTAIDKDSKTLDSPNDVTPTQVRVSRHSPEVIERMRLNNNHVQPRSRRPHSLEDSRNTHIGNKCKHGGGDHSGNTKKGDGEFVPKNNLDTCITPPDKLQDIPEVEPVVNIFTRNDVIRRISSTGCLKKIQDGIQLIPDNPANERSVILDNEKAVRLRSKDSNEMPGVENSVALNAEAKGTQDKIKDKTNEETLNINIQISEESSISDTNQHANSKQPSVMVWLKTNKIKRSKREMNTLSPNVF